LTGSHLPIIIIGKISLILNEAKQQEKMSMTGKMLSLPFVSIDQVESEIRKIVTGASQNVIFLDHTAMRMQEREITSRQVFNVLKNGELKDSPKWNTDKSKGWKCSFVRVTAGVKVTVVVKLTKEKEQVCLIVTVF
jgi:hypothetical protein